MAGSVKQRKQQTNVPVAPAIFSPGGGTPHMNAWSVANWWSRFDGAFPRNQSGPGPAFVSNTSKLELRNGEGTAGRLHREQHSRVGRSKGLMASDVLGGLAGIIMFFTCAVACLLVSTAVAIRVSVSNLKIFKDPSC